MKDRIDHLSLKCTIPIQVEDRLDIITSKGDFKIGLGQTTHTEDDQHMDKIIQVGQDMIQTIEVTMGIVQELARGMGGQIIAIIEEETLEVKITIGIGVDYMKDKIEIEGIAEALVIVNQGHIQGQLQIGIGLDASSVGNMIISCDCPTRQASRKVEQLQQMFNRDEDQTILQSPLMDTDQNKQTIAPVETMDNLNL